MNEVSIIADFLCESLKYRMLLKILGEIEFL